MSRLGLTPRFLLAVFAATPASAQAPVTDEVTQNTPALADAVASSLARGTRVRPGAAISSSQVTARTFQA